jgi:hypothetical protein
MPAYGVILTATALALSLDPPTRFLMGVRRN